MYIMGLPQETNKFDEFKYIYNHINRTVYHAKTSRSDRIIIRIHNNASQIAMTEKMYHRRLIDESERKDFMIMFTMGDIRFQGKNVIIA